MKSSWNHRTLSRDKNVKIISKNGPHTGPFFISIDHPRLVWTYAPTVPGAISLREAERAVRMGTAREHRSRKLCLVPRSSTNSGLARIFGTVA